MNISRGNLILLFAIFLINFNCKNMSTTFHSEEPERIRLVPKSAETDTIERGIDADSESNGIRIEWYRPIDEAVRWVCLFRRSEREEKFSLLMKISAKDTFFVDESVLTGERYFYFLRGQTIDEEFGPPSDTTTYRLLAKPIHLSSTGDVVPELSWYYPDRSPRAFFIRVENPPDNGLIWSYLVQNQFGNLISIRYNLNGTAILPELSSGRYRWRVDVLGSEVNSGAESKWSWLIR